MNDVLYKIARLVRDPSIQVDMVGFVFALAVSGLVAAVVSSLYQMFYENRATGSQIHRSFLLLGPSITALFIAVQFSLPLSLGLLGALSIIRFRTPIKEPEEVGFIMLLIAASVVCATFQFVLLLALLALSLAFLLVQKRFPGLIFGKRTDGMLLLIVDGPVEPQVRTRLLEQLKASLVRGKLQGISFEENLTTIQYSFNGISGEDADGLESGLRRIAPRLKLNLFFNGRGTLA